MDISIPIPKKPIKKVMLMFANQQWFKYDFTTTWNLSPYSLCMLAAMLPKDEYDIKIVDAQFYEMTEDQFRDEVKAFGPDIVGISVLTSEYASTADMAAEIIKSVDKNIITLMGGVHVTTQHKRSLRNKNVDYAVRGEGEYVFPEFLKYLNDKGPFPTKGMVYRGENDEIIALPSDVIDDLDALPRPDYGLIDYKLYTMTAPRYGVDTIPVFPYARLLTSRGCPVGCSFCQVEFISGKKWRYHSPERIVDDLIWLKEEYGINAFIFEDDNAFATRHRTLAMLKLLKSKNLNLQWKAAGVTIWTMNKEILDLMADTGCKMLGIAIETGTNRVMKDVIGKPVNLEKVPALIKIAQDRGIFIAANFIIGFPGETWDEIRQTLSYAEICGVDYAKVYMAQPLLGTRLYDMAVSMDAIVGDHEQVGWRYGRIKSKDFNPKDLSILRVYEWDRINFTDPKKREKTAKVMGISVDRLNDIRKVTRNKLTFENFDWSQIDTNLDEIEDIRAKVFSE